MKNKPKKLKINLIDDFSENTKIILILTSLAIYSIVYWKYSHLMFNWENITPKQLDDNRGGQFALYGMGLLPLFGFFATPLAALVYDMVLIAVDNMADFIPAPLIKAYYFSCVYFCFIAIPILLALYLTILIATFIFNVIKFLFSLFADFFPSFFAQMKSFHQKVNKL